MKIDRLIGIIIILLQQDKITAPELAKRFEVSRRTINRDVEDICKAGIPLITIQGHGGGISIADGYKIDKSLFTNEELQTIFTGLKSVDSISEVSHLTKLIEKLSSKTNKITDENVIIIDLASHYQNPLTQKIDIIKKAILNHHIISFKYYYEKGEKQRIIEPYKLIFKWSSWYVLGYCLDKKAFRLFKLNRLWDIQNSNKSFSLRDIPAEELNLNNYFTEAKINLKAIFAETEKYRLIEEYGANCYSTIENGKLLFEWSFVSYEHMLNWVLSFGDKVYILEPEKLRYEYKKQAENIIKMYEQ